MGFQAILFRKNYKKDALPQATKEIVNKNIMHA
jgi:hypothetical protein